MANVTFLIPCMGQLEYLKSSLRNLIGCPDSHTIVVDYSCPDHCGEWVREHFPQVEVVSFPDQSFFHHARARNVACYAVKTPWICFLNVDTQFHPRFFQQVLGHLVPGNFYLPEDQRFQGNFVVEHEVFKRIGGYDEMFLGWGEEDQDFLTMLRFWGVNQSTYSVVLIQELMTSLQQRCEYAPRVRNHHLAWLQNYVYRQIKHDLMLRRRALLSYADRESLRNQVWAALKQLPDPENPITVPISLEKVATMNPFAENERWQLKPTVHYDIRPIPNTLWQNVFG